MDDVSFENMHVNVGQADQLWILVDFAFGSKASDCTHFKRILLKLPGAEKASDHWQSCKRLGSVAPKSYYSELRDVPQNQLSTLRLGADARFRPTPSARCMIHECSLGAVYVDR